MMVKGVVLISFVNIGLVIVVNLFVCVVCNWFVIVCWMIVGINICVLKSDRVKWMVVGNSVENNIVKI